MSVNVVSPSTGELSKIATRGQFIQYSVMPTPSVDIVNKIVQYIGTSTASYINGYFYKCTEVSTGVYGWTNISVQAGGSGGGAVDSVNGKTGTVILDAKDIGLQYDTMPTASATYENQIVQYIGTTDVTYTNGYFYKCVEDGGVYSWVLVADFALASDVYTKTQVGALTDLPDTSKNIVQNIDAINTAVGDKADKVSSATNGDIATLDSNGNLTDGGILATNIITKSNTSGLVKNDGTIDESTYLTSADIADKADVVDGATVDDFATLDASGNLTDSGINKNIVPSNASSSNKLATQSDVSAAYRPSGNATLATLPALTEANLNRVYNMTADFTTTADFAEGAGIAVKAGNEVGIIDVSSTSTPDIKYTVLGGFIDLSDYIQKSQTSGLVKNDGSIDTSTYATTTQLAGKTDKVANATTDDFATLDSNGNLTDSGISKAVVPSGATSSNKLVTANDISTLPNKADKVSGATNGHLAGLDANGDLTDSGVVANNVIEKVSTATGLLRDDGTVDTSTYATTTQLANKADKVANASNGHLAGLDANGNLTDSGVLATSISGKADKVVSATDGDLAKLNSYGNLVDSGISASDVVTKSSTAGLIKNDGSIDETSYATTAKAYLTDDTAETTLDDADYVPFYDTSATAKKKTLWSNIKSVLKTYFDTIYSTIKTLAGLTDTDIDTSTLTVGQILEYDGVNWVNGDNITDFARYGGSKTFSQLDSSLLVAANIDKFFLITDGGTISSADASNWVLPAGSVIPADSHIAVIEYSTGVYKFDDFGGYIDISGKADKTELTPLYSTNDTVETDIADADYFPFYDTSATAKKKSTWTNIKSVLKTYFDGIYSTITTLSGLTDTTIATTPTDGQVLTYDSNTSKWINATPSGGGHTMTPTPSASLTRSDLQTAVASAVTEGGINDDVVSAWAIGTWSNTMTNRVIYSGTIAVGDTGIGTWLTDSQLAALRAETDPVAREALEVGTGGYGWWKDSHFIGLDSYNDYEIKIKYKLQDNDEIITLGGFILDTDTGCLCIKFGSAIKNAGNVVAVDITITQNNISSSGGA